MLCWFHCCEKVCELYSGESVKPHGIGQTVIHGQLLNVQEVCIVHLIANMQWLENRED